MPSVQPQPSHHQPPAQSHRCPQAPQHSLMTPPAPQGCPDHLGSCSTFPSQSCRAPYPFTLSGQKGTLEQPSFPSPYLFSLIQCYSALFSLISFLAWLADPPPARAHGEGGPSPIHPHHLHPLLFIFSQFSWGNGKGRSQ